MARSDISLGDAEIRVALRTHLLLDQCDKDTAVIEELGVCRGQVRIDLAVVNGVFHGYEIKSDRDSLRRLDRQIELYGKVLDYVTLVVGDRHLAAALDAVPPWWGVLRVHADRNGPGFDALREERKNPYRDSRSLVELLWLDNAIALLAQRDAARGVRGKPRRTVWDRVCEHFELEEIAEVVRAHLKTRATNQVALRPS